jgi:glycosyltransferase involved in cell wall biosynthesis
MITVVTIAKNEEDRIERMIKSAHQLTDQVVVVDTGSKDDTADVARNAGAAVLHDPWVDFGHNLTRAIMWASEGTDWILRMDADMVISALHPTLLIAAQRCNSRCL